MSQPADDRQLGELLVSTGRLSQHQLLAALEWQQQHSGSTRKRLGEILVELGHLSFDELATALNKQDKQILWCPRCRVQVNVRGSTPGSGYACQQCQGRLESAPNPRKPGVRDTWPAMPVPVIEDMSGEMQRAMADPSRRIGRYVVLSELGRGGMGVVYRCHDPQLARTVALKKILETVEIDDEDRARFQREARAAAKIRHSGIVAVHEVGEDKGRPFLVMDFVEGETFNALINRKKVSPRRVAEILRDTAQALHHAHEAGITHRDIKPHNIMLDTHGKPHVMDFGLARDNSAQQQLTQTGQIIGTPAYMAPEQANANSDRQGPLTDVYALGAVLYRALAGRPVFQADSNLGMLKKVLLDEPEPLREIDDKINADLETIALKCLEKAPRRRYASAADVASELQHFLDGEAIVARPIGRREKALRWLRRNPALSAALLAVVAVVVGATALVIRQASEARQFQQELVRKAEVETARREERARLEAAQEATTKEQSRARAAGLESLRLEVSEVLHRVRSGSHLEDEIDRLVARAAILKHHDLETVKLLSAELEQLTQRLAETHELTSGEELYLAFLCETLGYLGLSEHAVSALGRYLEAEFALPTAARNQIRAVPAGKALCLLGGADSANMLLIAEQRFGSNAPFWGQIKPLFKRTGNTSSFEATSAASLSKRAKLRSINGDLEGAIADYTQAIELEPGTAVHWGKRGEARRKTGDINGAIADGTRAIELDAAIPELWNNRGIARSQNNDAAGAMADYAHAIKLDPRKSILWYNRGNANTRLGRIDDALRDFTRAIELSPDHSMYWAERGMARVFNGDHPGAIADYNTAIKLDASNVAAWNGRGFSKGATGDTNGAIADCTRAIELDSTFAKPWWNRGTIRSAQGDNDGAIADFTRAIAIDPEFAKAYQYRGRLHAQGGDLDSALADYTSTLEIDPTDIKTYFYRGNARLQNGDLDGAIADYTRALEIDPRSTDAARALGQARTKKGDIEGAIADFTHAIEIDPKNVEAYRERALLRYRRGDLDEAIADLTSALEIDPKSVKTLRLRGTIKKNKGDLEGAIADLTRAIEMDPRSALSWGSRGDARRIKGDLDGASADYTRTIEIDPGFAIAWQSRGDIRRQNGDHDGADSDYTRAIELNPNVAIVFFNRGLLRQGRDDLDSAIADYTRAIEIDPNTQKSRINRGNCWFRKGNLDGAIADWQRLLELAPDHNLAPAIRSQLERARALKARQGDKAGK